MVDTHCGNCGMFIEDTAGAQVKVELQKRVGVPGAPNDYLVVTRRLCTECAHRLGETIFHERPPRVGLAAAT